MLIEIDGECTEIDLYRGDSDHLNALLWWAGRLAGRCVGGATSDDSPDYPTALGEAVWLILAGIWPRVSVEATVYPRRGWSLVPIERRLLPQTPHLVIRVEAVDTPLRMVNETYQNLRKETELSKAGHPLAPESEVLCMAAHDVHEIDSVKSGEPGFLEAVLKRYRAKATHHGVSPDAFPDTAGGHEKAGDALASAVSAYGELYPGHALLGGFDSAS